jgi:hypothetical protein
MLKLSFLWFFKSGVTGGMSWNDKLRSLSRRDAKGRYFSCRIFVRSLFSMCFYRKSDFLLNSLLPLDLKITEVLFLQWGMLTEYFLLFLLYEGPSSLNVLCLYMCNFPSCRHISALSLQHFAFLNIWTKERWRNRGMEEIAQWGVSYVLLIPKYH